MKVIKTAKAPLPIGCYSQAIQWNNMTFLSGQIGIDPNSSELVSDDCETQFRQALANMKEVIIEAKNEFKNIVKLTIYLVDMKDFSKINEVMKNVFTEPYPARTTIQVAALPKGAQVEIDAILISPNI